MSSLGEDRRNRACMDSSQDLDFFGILAASGFVAEILMLKEFVQISVRHDSVLLAV